MFQHLPCELGGDNASLCTLIEVWFVVVDVLNADIKSCCCAGFDPVDVVVSFSGLQHNISLT